MAAKKNNIGQTVVLVTGGLLFTGMLQKAIIDPIFEFLNLKDTDAEKLAKKQADAQTKLGIWNPGFVAAFIVPSGCQLNLIKVVVAYDIAHEIYMAWGYFNDDEEAVYGQFRKIPTQAALSQVANQYLIHSGKDLYNDCKSRMSSSEFAEVLDIVSKMPLGLWDIKNKKYIR